MNLYRCTISGPVFEVAGERKPFYSKNFLTEEGQLNRDNYPERIFLVPDNPDSFRSSGERYLDRKIHKVNLVDIGDLERTRI